MDESTTNGDGTVPTANGGNGQNAPDQDAIKMFVGQIPRSWNEAELKQLFNEFGPVYQLNILRDKSTAENRGCCFVTFYHRRDAIACQGALHNVKTLPGMHHPIQMKPADSENRNERKLFVGMVSKKANEDEIKAMFVSFGLIEDCTVLRDATGNSKGCAFVTFSSRASALNAIKTMHQSRTMEGCSMPLVVKFADSQKDKDQKKIGGPSPNQPVLGAAAATGLAGLMPYGTTNIPVTSPLLRHSNLMGSAGSNIASYLALLQNLPGAASSISQMPSIHTPVQHASTGLNMANMSVLNSLSGGYGLNSQLNGNGASSQANMASLINYLLTAAAVSGNQAANVTNNNLSAYQNAHMASSFPQTWKQPHGLTSASSLSPAALNGNLISLTGNGNASAQFLSQAYAGGAAMPYYGTSAQSPLGLAATGNGNSSKQTEGPEGANLFIYHLPQEFTDNDLAQTFSAFGTMLSAKVFVDKQTNLSKCFGFVSYDNPSSATAAINAMNGFQVGTKRLKVQLKRSKQEAKPYQHPQHNEGAKIRAEDGGNRTS